MCGIAGFVNSEGFPADRSTIARMTATLRHRGPDGDGFHCQGPVALGHRRLSIVDVAAGDQPMANEDESIWVTYNGEIYNEFTLRDRLLKLGHQYRTHCDTESIVHLYEERGLDFARDLNGMFALALWDQPRNRLVLARDRMGQKPLYYAITDRRGLVFGSEAKAVLAHPDVARQIDPAGLARYLFHEYLPGAHSIWSGLQKLLPGHILVWDQGQATIRRYWEPPAPTDPPEPFDQAAGIFWERFRSSVARHCRADVPLGVFLSGGIDSSAVAAAVREWEPSRPIQTFSIGFDDPSFDESGHARTVAAYLGTEHHEQIFSAQGVFDLLPEVAGWLDEPFGDASVLPTHLLSRFARTEVTVALGGDGADELMAGYPTFGAERASRIFGRLPGLAQSLIRRGVAQIPVDHRNLSFDFKLKQFLRGAGEPMALAHQRWLGSFAGGEIAALLVAGPPIDVEAEHLARMIPFRGSRDPLRSSLDQYQTTYLPDDILFKVDRASMACGLEVRAPFLDAELVDWLATLPPSYQRHQGISKRLLKRAAVGHLPASILGRPKKGFGIPVARWLRGPLAPLLHSLLEPGRLGRQGLFRPTEVSKIVREHLAGTRDHRKPLWTLLMFQLWHDQWLGQT